MIIQSSKLRVIINENLTCTDHLNILISKVSMGIGVIRRLSRIMPADVLPSFCNSLIHPTLSIAILRGIHVGQLY